MHLGHHILDVSLLGQNHFGQTDIGGQMGAKALKLFRPTCGQDQLPRRLNPWHYCVFQAHLGSQKLFEAWVRWRLSKVDHLGLKLCGQGLKSLGFCDPPIGDQNVR